MAGDTNVSPGNDSDDGSDDDQDGDPEDDSDDDEDDDPEDDDEDEDEDDPEEDGDDDSDDGSGDGSGDSCDSGKSKKSSSPYKSSVLAGSPDSLPTVGERVRLHVMGGGGAVPMRWGKTICFGDGFRLNYLSYFQLTTDGLYARLYDPTAQAVHNFRTDHDAPTTRIETIAMDGDVFTMRQYDDCYLGETPGMNRVTLKTYTRADEERPGLVEIVYPEGGSLHYEFDSYDAISGDIAGPLYRVVKRVTKKGHAVTFAYGDDRLVIRDASGNEYVCFLEADNHIVRIAVQSRGETRTWSYAYTSGKIIETNDQTGLKLEMQGTNYVTGMNLTPSSGLRKTVTFARDANGNLTSLNVAGDSRKYAVTALPTGNTRQVETRDGRTVTREYDANGLVSRENSLGERQEYLYDSAKRMTYYKNALGDEWRYEYSNPGDIDVLLRRTAPDGGETRFEYLPGTDLVSMKRIKLADGVWRTIAYSYDANKRLVQKNRQLGDGRVAVTRHIRRDDGTIQYTLKKVDDSHWTATYYEHNIAGKTTLVKGPYEIVDPDNPDIGLPATGKRYAYDAWGNLASKTDELGNTTRYEYDGGNRRVAVVDPLGRRTEYAYDGLGRRVSQTDALGNRTEWAYNQAGRVTSVQGGAGVAGCGSCALAAGTFDKPGTYVWSNNGLLTSFKDLEGKTTKYEYDAARRKSKETDPLGKTTLFGYDAAGNLATVTDPLGNVTRYGYDAARRRVSTTDPLGNVSGVEYDLAGRSTRAYDSGGGERLSTYGVTGRLLSERTGVDGSTWRETRYAYNMCGQLTEKIDAFGSDDEVVTLFEYDAAGRMARSVIDPSGLNIAGENIYDAAGRLVENRDGNGNATLVTYDAGGNQSSVATGEGRITAFSYDDVGRRIETVLDPDGVAQGAYVAYDAAGRVLEMSDGVASRSFVYDKVGRRTRTTVPGQADSVMVYDAAGRLLETRRLNANGTTAMTAKNEYDAAGRMTKTIDEAGNATLYEYDAAGRLVKTTDPLGAETRFEYDAAGRQTRVILPLGGERRYFYNLAGELIRTEGGPEGTRQYRYDALGRQVEVVDANGRSKTVAYDKAGRVVRMENEMGQAVSYTYDPAGNRLSLTDANGNATLYQYDRDNRVVLMRYPDVAGQPANVETYQYDGAGRLACKTTPNGDSIRFRYDPAGNVEAMYHGAFVAYGQEIPSAQLIAKYERDASGALTKEEDCLTAMLYSYDAFGRMVEAKDNGLNKAVRYGYDLRSLRNRMDVVDYSSSSIGSISMSVAYGYDAAGRLLSVKKDSDPAALYAYDLSGRRTSLTLPNEVATAYTYDGEDRLLQLVTAKDAAVLASFAYTLDPTGNRTGITYADGSRSVYSFDNAYRLTRDLRLDGSDQTLYDESFTYDDVGNRLAKVRTGWNPVNVQYAYNARNQLASSTDGKSYSYDANGNTVAVTAAGGNELMQYDVLNRLVRFAGLGGVEETQYRGAAWHRRNVSEQAAGASDPMVTAFLYADDDVVADYANGTALSRLYVTPNIDRNLSMTVAGGATYYYSQDGLGSVRTLSDAAGVIQSRHDYTAFGENLDSTTSVPQRYAFTGRETMSMTNELQFYRHRNYNSSIGGFMSRDILQYDANIYGNVYEYVYSRPGQNIDPMGLSHRGVNWDGNMAGSRDCLMSLCDSLPSDDDCSGSTETKEQCIREAVRSVSIYADVIDEIRANSICGRLGLVGGAGNICSFVFDGGNGIGCVNIASHVNGRIVHPGSSGFYHKIINAEWADNSSIFSMPWHSYVAFKHKASNKVCVTTGWETGTPSMQDASTYKYWNPSRHDWIK